MTAKETKSNKGESPEVVAKRQAAYRQKQMNEGLIRAQLWVTPEEKVYLNTQLDTLRNTKSIRDVSKDNPLTKDILSGDFYRNQKKWLKNNSEKYYSNAFFNTDEYSYGQLRNNIPRRLGNGLILFKLKNTSIYPIIRLRGLGDPSVICAILYCLHAWYFDSQQKFDRRKKMLNLKLHNIGEDIKRMVYKAKASNSLDLTNTPFAFLTQPIFVEAWTMNENDLESIDSDQLLIVLDDDFKICKCSDKSFLLEDILRWPSCVVEPIYDSSLSSLNIRHNFMRSLIDLFMVGTQNEIPVMYLNRLG